MFKFRVTKRSEVGRQAQVRALMGLIAMSLLLASSAVQAEAGRQSVLVDLNRASAEELAELPGIGAAKAAAIVEYRKSSGAFASIDDLEAVRGIGPALIAKLRPHVTAGSGKAPKSPSKTGVKRPSSALK